MKLLESFEYDEKYRDDIRHIRLRVKSIQSNRDYPEEVKELADAVSTLLNLVTDIAGPPSYRNWPVEFIPGLATRTYTALAKANVRRVQDLIDIGGFAGLIAIRGISHASAMKIIIELRKFLREHGEDIPSDTEG